MTFEQFQATRVWSDDLSGVSNGAFTGCGQVYNGGLCIESALGIEAATGEYVLTIGNAQCFGDLESLEHDLFEFAQAEDLL